MTTLLIEERPNRSDVDIHRDVLAELRWDTRVGEAVVGVEVNGGVVTLTGTVGSYATKYAAQEAAHRVEGVLDMANDIDVKLPGDPKVTDTEIAQAVRRALEWDVRVPHECIRSTVTQGHVTLEGTVPFWVDRYEAVRAIRNLQGVRGIVCHIHCEPKVGDEQEREDAQIRQGIEAALTRQAPGWQEQVHVDVEDGVASLVGKVRSQAQREALLRTAAHAPGIHKIVNCLRITPLQVTGGQSER